MSSVSEPSLQNSAGHKSGAIEQQHPEQALIATPKYTRLSTTGPPAFKFSSTWRSPVLNPLNLKSYTVPFFNIRSAYGRTLHLSWLGFFVACELYSDDFLFSD
jgi:hypothetical protein